MLMGTDRFDPLDLCHQIPIQVRVALDYLFRNFDRQFHRHRPGKIVDFSRLDLCGIPRQQSQWGPFPPFPVDSGSAANSWQVSLFCHWKNVDTTHSESNPIRSGEVEHERQGRIDGLRSYRP